MMVLTQKKLLEKYNDYTDAKGKIAREIKAGNLFTVVRGLYETDSNTAGYLLSQYIYGPSYLSFDYALYLYSLIPEAVYNTYTCSTFNKRRRKQYTNIFGTFIYQDVPMSVYPYGVIAKQENGYSYQIATPEKALCDKLYSTTSIGSVKSLKELLFDDLRIDEEAFNNLNKEELLFLAPLYRSKNLNFLIKLIKGEN